jgi:hypothetical protein
MRTFLLLLIAAAMIIAGCKKNNPAGQSAPATNTTATATNRGSLATAPVDYLNTMVQAQKSANKTIDVSYINQALQLFNVQEGRYPKNLQELVPNYVAKIPDAPPGSKIVHDATSGTVKVVQQP